MFLGKPSTEGGSKNPVSRSIARKFLIKKPTVAPPESMLDSSVIAGAALSVKSDRLLDDLPSR
jgi:hypothetical protein